MGKTAQVPAAIVRGAGEWLGERLPATLMRPAPLICSDEARAKNRRSGGDAAVLALLARRIPLAPLGAALRDANYRLFLAWMIPNTVFLSLLGHARPEIRDRLVSRRRALPRSAAGPGLVVSSSASSTRTPDAARSPRTCGGGSTRPFSSSAAR